MDLPGLPSWDGGAAEDLAAAVRALRCELGSVAAALARVERTAQDGWSGAARDRFDERIGHLRRLLGDLSADAEPVAARVWAGADAYHERRRAVANAAGLGLVDEAATWMGW
jgi:hypothetical protein